MIVQEQLKVGDVDRFHICRVFIKVLSGVMGDKEYPSSENSDNDDKVNSPTDPPPPPHPPSSSLDPFGVLLDDMAGNLYV